MTKQGRAFERKPGCMCETCEPNSWAQMRMILCQECGNKRCPHATWHMNKCTQSNNPGQAGSAYANVKPIGGQP